MGETEAGPFTGHRLLLDGGTVSTRDLSTSSSTLFVCMIFFYSTAEDEDCVSLLLTTLLSACEKKLKHRNAILLLRPMLVVCLLCLPQTENVFEKEIRIMTTQTHKKKI